MFEIYKMNINYPEQSSGLTKLIQSSNKLIHKAIFRQEVMKPVAII